MKLRKAINHILLATLLLTGADLSAQAQKLNNIQENGLWAPANVKADGKLTEWGNTLQAYNKTTDIYYTMANDDKNLYFIMKSSDQIINNKFIAGGINITINTTGKKNEKGAYVITYPLVDMAGLRNQVMTMRTTPGPAQHNEALSGMDSTTIAMRRRMLGNIKELKLSGFAAADVADSVISIYNTYGIKTGVDYDNMGNLSAEVIIPLKYLHLTGDDFAYNIKLNGLNLMAMMPPAPTAGGMGGVAVDVVRAPANVSSVNMSGASRGMSDMQNMVSPTDFWAKYTMVKK